MVTVVTVRVSFGLATQIGQSILAVWSLCGLSSLVAWLLRSQSILMVVISTVHFCVDNFQYRILQIICSSNNNLINLTTFELVRPSAYILD